MNPYHMNTDPVRSSDFLAGIPGEDYAHLLNRGQRIHLGPRETVFREGDPADKCYWVLSGRLRLIKLHPRGKEVVVRYIGPGELTAAVAVFKGKNYPVTAEGVCDTSLVGWDKETIEGLLLEKPRLAFNMLRAAVDRLDDLQTRYLELCAEEVEQRIARSLLRIMKHSGRKTDEGVLIDFRLSRQELADYTGTTLYTVSRTLSTWGKMGWIKSGRERIILTNPHALVMFAENEKIPLL